MADYATLQVHRATKDALAGLRRAGETFDAVLRRLMGEAKRAEEAEFFQELDALYQDDGAFEPLR